MCRLASPAWSCRILFLVPQNDPSSVAVLVMLGVDAAQFQVGGPLSQLHVDPAMGMAFAEIVADRWLVDEMDVAKLIMLPFVRVAVNIGPGMLAVLK